MEEVEMGAITASGEPTIAPLAENTGNKFGPMVIVPETPQGGIPVHGSYVAKATEIYAVNHQIIYGLDGKFYLNCYEFGVKQDAENYANSMNSELPPEVPLTFEQRFDAVLIWLRDKHGFHLPPHLAPAPLPEPTSEPKPPTAPKE